MPKHGSMANMLVGYVCFSMEGKFVTFKAEVTVIAFLFYDILAVNFRNRKFED